MSDLVTRLFDSDEASALTNEAAREIERQKAALLAAEDLANACTHLRHLNTAPIEPADDAMAYLQRQTEVWETTDAIDAALAAYRRATGESQ